MSAALEVLPKLTRAWSRANLRGLLTTKWCVQLLRRPPSAARRLLVAGVQRSGTNMVMDVLERSYRTAVFHERDPRAFDNYQLRAEPVIDALFERSRAELVVVKCLMESHKLAVLLERFAPTKALWVFRDYRDVVNSMVRSFRNQAKQVARIARDRDADGWLGAGMSDETHAVVRRFAATPLDDLSAAAVQWYFRNIRFFEQGLADDPRVLPVCYEDLVTDPGPQFARIFRFAGLALEPRVVKQVRASSIGRHAEPALRPDVEARCTELYQRLTATAAKV